MQATQIFLAICLSIALAVPVLKGLPRLKKSGLLTPPVTFSLFVFLGYVVPIQSYTAGTDYFSEYWATSYADFNKSLTGALALALTGVLGFYLGYFLPLKVQASRAGHKSLGVAQDNFRWNTRRLVGLGVAYTSVGLVLFSIGIWLLGGIGVLLSNLGDRTRLFTGLNYFILPVNLLLSFTLLWWQYVLKTRKFWDLKFWSYAVFSIGMVSLEGAKSTIFVFLLAGAIMYDLNVKRIRPVTILAGALVVFVFLTFYALFFREYLAVGAITSLDPASKDGTSLFVVQRDFEGNFMQLQCLTVLVDAVPLDLPLQYGKTFLSLLTMPVPNPLWPSKPLPAPGVFTVALWPDRWFISNTTLPPGLMGELYMNFSVVGPFLGMCIFGRLYRRAYESALHPESPPQVILYSVFLPMMVHYLRGEFVSPTILFLLLFLPIYWGFHLVADRRRIPVEAQVTMQAT